MKTNSGKKGEGMPVVRNPQFYFREGFCWNNVLTTYMKCKKKEKTVQSTESMSFFSCVNQVPEFYLISLMNSRFAAIYVDNFINSTSHCTTGDAKLIPVLIPDNEILKSCNRLFTSAFELKKSVAKGITTDISIQSELEIIEEENDNLIACLYSI
ncbi:DNA modification methylase [Bacteroides ovatus]|uniref:DNA modification methylase n=1 Tax=Bacteroides ovatus TaxID=28116 RepID=UPI00298DBAF4|nr:DNA modification methylase [Bacteroides ovatus]MDW7579918.1 DNA modification methylase [Bacteroides ovatus]